MLHLIRSSVLFLILANYYLVFFDGFVDGQTDLSSLDAFNQDTCGRAIEAANRSDAGKRRRGLIITTRGSGTRAVTDFLNTLRHRNSSITPYYRSWIKKPLGRASSRSALAGEVPWYVTLQTFFNYRDDPNEIRFPRCSGTLIHRDLILTAAHCLKRGKYLATKDSYALFGLSDWKENKVAERVRFRKMCLPKDYQPQWSRNFTVQGRDFALIKLEKAVEYSDLVRPACMHSLQSCQNIKRKRHCKAVGFGHQMIGFRPTQLGAVPMRACWLDELKPSRPDELCFVATKKQEGQLNVIDRGSGIYCQDADTKRTYVVGVSTVNIQPPENICCPEKPQQLHYTDLYRWRDEISKLLENCLGTT